MVDVIWWRAVTERGNIGWAEVYVGPPTYNIGGAKAPSAPPVPSPHPPRVMNNQLPINLSGLLLSIIVQIW